MTFIPCSVPINGIFYVAFIYCWLAVNSASSVKQSVREYQTNRDFSCSSSEKEIVENFQYIVISQSHVRPPSFYSFIRKCLLEIIIFRESMHRQANIVFTIFESNINEASGCYVSLPVLNTGYNSFNSIYHRNSVKNPQNVLWEWYFPMNIYKHIVLLIRRNMRCLFFRSFVRSPTFVNEPP